MALPLAVFGVLTDVQYADTEDAKAHSGKSRYYRNSLELVEAAVQAWKEYEETNNTSLKFVIQLGDLLDGKSRNDPVNIMNRVLKKFDKFYLDSKLFHIWGNHELYNFKRTDLANTPLNTAKILNKEISNPYGNYYTYEVTENVKMICLDFYDYSVIGHDPDNQNYKDALDLLQKYNKNEDLNNGDNLSNEKIHFVAYNGGLHKDQLIWLEDELKDCQRMNKKAIICGHIPIEMRSSDKRNMPWNVEKIKSIIYEYSNICLLYLAGHCHHGGVFKDEHDILHITLPGIIEVKPGSDSYATVKVYEKKITIDVINDSDRFETKKFDIDL